MISVVIPLYNNASHIRHTIESVLVSPDNLLEIIVIDDGSTDNGGDVVRSIADDRIRLITQKNAGVSNARNLGILEAKGELVAFLDSDDRYQPGFLKAIFDLYCEYPHAIAYTTSYSYCENGMIVEPKFSKFLPPSNFKGIVTDFHLWSRGAAFFYTSSACINRQQIIDKHLFFPEGEQAGEDYDLWFRLAEDGEIAFFRQSLVVYYRGIVENNLSGMIVKDKILPCYNRLISRVESGAVPKKMRNSAKRTYANQLIEVTLYHVSKNNFQKAFSWLTHRYALHARLYWIKTAMFFLHHYIIHLIQNVKSRPEE